MSYVRLLAIGALLGGAVEISAPSVAQAQFRVGISAGFVRYQGGSEPMDPADTIFLEPYGPLDFRLRTSYSTGDWQFGLAAAYAKPGLGAAIDFFLFVDRDAMKVVTIEPTIGRRVLGARDGASRLTLEAGPVLWLWMLNGAETRTEFGGVVAATLRQRLVGPFESVIRGDVSLSPTFFRPEDNTGNLIRFTNVSRYGFSIGFDFRL